MAVLLDSYRRTRGLVARRQVKWLLWGTTAGVFPFLAFYALPFSLGREPGLALQLAGYGPLALVPLSLAYAVVRHRLMDVELIFRRALGFVLAVAVIVGLALLTVGLTDVIWEEPHTTLIALLSALVVVLLFTPVKARIQETLDRLFYKERYSSRKALVRLTTVMGLLVMVLGALLAGTASYRLIRKEKQGAGKFAQGEMVQVLLLLACIVAYLALIRIFGYLVLTPIFMFAMMYLFGMRQWIKMVLISVVTAVATYFLFNNLLLVLLPRFNLF